MHFYDESSHHTTKSWQAIDECLLKGTWRSENIIYKCAVAATGHPRKVYLGTAEGDFKQRYYNHKKSFRNGKYANKTSVSK